MIRVPVCARVSCVSRVCPGSPRCLFPCVSRLPRCLFTGTGVCLVCVPAPPGFCTGEEDGGLDVVHAA